MLGKKKQIKQNDEMKSVDEMYIVASFIKDEVKYFLMLMMMMMMMMMMMSKITTLDLNKRMCLYMCT